MKKSTRMMIMISLVITVATLITWQVTGGDYYTKYQVVEQVEVELDENDPLVQAGFYDDDNPQTETITKDEFHFGLLPTPTSLFDKHAISVVSISSAPWGISVIMFLAGRIQKRKKSATGQ